MAPEVIKGKGYDISVDLWSIGIMLYEFIACSLPFGEGLDDSLAVYDAICHQKLQFPRQIHSHPAIKVISKLVNRDPNHRRTAADLKKDPWFSDMDWEALSYHFIKPNYIPQKQEINKNGLMEGTIKEIMLADEAKDPVFAQQTKAGPAGWDDEF